MVHQTPLSWFVCGHVMQRLVCWVGGDNCRAFNEYPLSRDFAGVVVEAGPGDHGYKAGDEVYGNHWSVQPTFVFCWSNHLPGRANLI